MSSHDHGPQDGEEDMRGAADGSGGGDNFKVVIRVRPPLPRELKGSALRPYQCTTHVDEVGRNIVLSENLPAVLQGAQGVADGMLYSTYRFAFDHVYDQHCSQEDVYVNTAQHVVLSILQGYNAAIMAYGQTGTGKTYTMEGDLEGPLRGIIPRTVEDIFTYIVNDPEPSSKYLVRASYLQIYNEVISDLLKPERMNLAIREDRRRGVFVEGLSEWVVRSPNEVYQLMARGQAMRATGSTKLNEVSSRSHAVCIVIVEKCTSDGLASQSLPNARPGSANSNREQSYSIKVGKLNLVDLAGSERVHVTGAVGKRLEESKKINASLSALGNVIAALTDPRDRTHIPYRDSKLTRILEDSLGGNCRTTMICTIAPSMESYHESLSTLKFANRAKNIKNEAHVNEDLDQRTLLRKYERELRRLRAELQRRSRELVDKRALLEVEEQKRRAEADKLAALTALEKRSREFLKEKEEKRQLEQKISAMQSQLLVGGAKLEDVPAFRAILAREHKRIRGEYEARLRELESERQAVEEDRQQVDRYKQLLLKQRDIMIALTARLNERDEQINSLQEELEAYDRYQRQLEDTLDAKTAELIALRKAAVEHAAAGNGVSPGVGVKGPGSPRITALQTALGAWGDASDGGAGASTSMEGPSGRMNQDTRQVMDKSRGSSLGPEDVSRMLAEGLRLGPNEEAQLLARLEERDAAMMQLQSENARLQQELAASRTGATSTPRGLEVAVSDAEELAQLAEEVQRKDAELVQQRREKQALRTILESRLQMYLQDMVQDTAGALDASAQGYLSPEDTMGALQRLLPNLQTMQHVVDKIIEAIGVQAPETPRGDAEVSVEPSPSMQQQQQHMGGKEGYYTNGGSVDQGPPSVAGSASGGAYGGAAYSEGQYSGGVYTAAGGGAYAGRW